jgi:inner membrane protein
MDSLSQIVLGAAVAAVMVPAKHRRAALLAGAALGTLPDLDAVALKLLTRDPVKQMVWHRGASHSIFLLPLVGWLIWWWYRGKSGRVAEAPRAWFWAMQLALITHPLLDCFTVYGTQLLWPLATPPIMWSSVFVIDPLYTLPLLVACVWAWIGSGKALRWGLVLSTSYLAWGLVAKLYVERQADAELRQLELADAPRLSTPTPFNTLLWRVVVMAPEGEWLEGYRSLVADSGPMEFRRFKTDPSLLPAVKESAGVKALAWFNQGFMSAELEGRSMVVTDLRMGGAPHFVFRFKVAELQDGKLITTDPEQLPWPGDPRELLRMVWDRLCGRDRGSVI